MSDFPAAEFRLDGDPAAIRSSASRWSSFGHEASDAATQIRSLDTSLFIGPEGDQYRQGLNDSLPPHLETTGAAYTKVAGALSDYASTLSGLQDRMRPLAAKAPALWQAVQAAQGRLTSARAADQQHAHTQAVDAAARPAGEPAPPDNYRSVATAANTSLSQAHQAWNDCLAAARAVKTDLRTAVDRCTGTIHHAADTRFKHNPHGFGALVAGFKDFVKDHVAGLAKLSGVLKLVSGIAGVLSFIPVIGEVALPIALIAGGAALAIDASIKFSTGRGSWASIAVDGALMALPFGIGRGAEALRAARGAKALQGIRATKTVTQDVNAARGLENTGTKLTDNILELKYKDGWTAAQRAEADMKVKQLDELGPDGKLIKSEPERFSNLRERFQKEGGFDKLPADKDVDHIHELQLGGRDDVPGNVQLLDRSVNRSIGAQISHRIAEHDLGTVYTGVTIGPR